MEYSELSDEQLLGEAKKMKTNAIYKALAIGFMTGVII